MTSHGVLMSGLLNARAARLLRALHLTRIPPNRRSLLVLILVVSSREFPSTSSQKISLIRLMQGYIRLSEQVSFMFLPFIKFSTF